MHVLVTGDGGCLGSKGALLLLKRGNQVIAIDNMPHFCDVILHRTHVADFSEGSLDICVYSAA